MKKMIALIVVMTILFLSVTKSLYVEWTELYIIIGSLSVMAVWVNLFSKPLGGSLFILTRSAMIGFLFCWVFGLFDLFADHFLYFLPSGKEDGRALSLGFKIQEYSDDLLVGSVITMVSVIVTSWVFTTILSKVMPRKAA